MNEQELTKFCDDFAYEFVAGLVFNHEFDNITCKAMRGLYDGLKNSLFIRIQEFTDKKGD